ncbi:uncharacterized protein O3C94_016502 [Discoglossus pictus]
MELTPSPSPPHPALPAGPPSPPPMTQAALAKMLAIMKRMDAGISAIRHSLDRHFREEKRHHLMLENYMAGLLRTGLVRHYHPWCHYLHPPSPHNHQHSRPNKKMAERILSHALEIISLLTGDVREIEDVIMGTREFKNVKPPVVYKVEQEKLNIRDQQQMKEEITVNMREDSDNVTPSVLSESDQEEETNMRSPRQIKEEEIPVNISEGLDNYSLHIVTVKDEQDDEGEEDGVIEQIVIPSNPCEGLESRIAFWNRSLLKGGFESRCLEGGDDGKRGAEGRVWEEERDEWQEVPGGPQAAGTRRRRTAGKGLVSRRRLGKGRASGTGQRGQGSQPQLGEQEAEGRSRAHNYTYRENVVLLGAICDRPIILAGGREVKPGPRAQAWKEVAAEVTAVGTERDVKSVKHRLDDIRAKMRRKMAREDEGRQVDYNAWERVARDLLRPSPAAGASAPVAQLDLSSMSASRRRSESVEEPETVAFVPDQQEPVQGKEEEEGSAEGPGSEEGEVIVVVESPPGPSGTQTLIPPIPFLERLMISLGPYNQPDIVTPPSSQTSALVWPPATAETAPSPLSPAGPQTLPTPPTAPPHLALHPAGLPSPPSHAAQAEMLALMREQVASMHRIEASMHRMEASISANHAQVMHSLASISREGRRHHLMHETYMARLLGLVSSPPLSTPEASPRNQHPGFSSPPNMTHPIHPPPPAEAFETRRRPATEDVGPDPRRRRT